MIKSMTGYGRGQAEISGLSFSIEIKAVNHRYGDITIKAPRLLAPFEAELKKQIAAVLKRGKIDVFISQNKLSALTAVPVIDAQLTAAYLAAFRQLKEISGLAGEISLDLLAAQQGVMTLQEVELAGDDLRDCLGQALQNALSAIQVMRENEGRTTALDMEERLKLLHRTLQAIRDVAPRVPLEWQEKLRERLAKLQDTGGDPQRVAQEVALFADRCDISEELLRFESHLGQFRELLEQQDPVGRQMDFLVQELNREANTMGSKSNDALLTRHVVVLKSELEKIREQVQNIE